MPDITITNQWQSLSTLSGIAVGTSMKVQNKSSVRFVAFESNTQPSESSNEGEIVTSLLEEEPSKTITAGSLEVWVKTLGSSPDALAFVQTL